MTFANLLWMRLLIFDFVWLSMGIFVEAKIWAFLVATSHNPLESDCVNYRHQGDVCHAYQLLKSRGIPEENIIVMMLDDVVNHPKNPTPGKIVYEPNGEDVYAGVQVDYRDHDANKENFLAVLLGDKSKVKGNGTGRVLESSIKDNVFMFVTGIGAVGSIQFQGKGGGSVVSAKELTDTLKKMYDTGRYHKLVFYLELCFGGSMFETLPDNLNIYAVTAANAHQESKAGYCNDKSFKHLCYTDMFTLTWITDSEQIRFTFRQNNDLTKRSLEKQYKYVKKLTTESEIKVQPPSVVEAVEIPPEVKEFCEQCPKGDNTLCIQKDGELKCKTDTNGDSPCGGCFGVCVAIPNINGVLCLDTVNAR